MLRRYFNLAVFAGLTVSLIGCAQRLGDIDTTQPNVIDKAMFTDGANWHYREMVTDVETLAAYSYDAQRNWLIIGMPSSLFTIRWEIHEDFLLGIAIDELWPGANDVGENRTLEETIVARYPIISHFDMRKQYNQSTGEESNVLIEDTSSRKWDERTHMRIDWSNNLSVSLMSGVQNSGSQLLIQKDQNEDNNHEQLEITPDYITTVVDWTVGVWSHSSSQMQVLTSIVKIDPTDDYQAWDFPAQVKKRDAEGKLVTDAEGETIEVDVFNRYGFFQTWRQHHDKYDGKRDANEHYYINRFDIFKDWTDANGDVLPVQERELDPIVYFMADDYPTEMKPAAKRLGEIWNAAFMKALVQVGYPVEAGDAAFVVCDNPVTTASPAACQDKVTRHGYDLSVEPKTVLFGDLRFNFLKLARPVGTVNPLGFGPSSHDMRTGKTVNGWAVTYYAALNSYAKRALEMVKVYNGEIDPDSLDWLEGEFQNGAQDVFDAFAGNNGNDNGNQNAQGMASEYLEAAAPQLQELAQAFKNTPEMQGIVQEINNNMTEAMGGRTIMQAMADVDVPDGAAFNQLADDGFEGFMPTRAQQEPELLDAIMDNYNANPVKAIMKTFASEEERMRSYAAQNIYLEEFADPTVGYIAKRMAQKYQYPAPGTPNRAELVAEIDEQIIKELRDAIYIGVQLHEIGHNLGLRHNFAGSTDEVNYIQPGISSTTVTSDVFAGNSGDEMKGYWDVAMNANGDREERLEYQYSSIMDYGAGFSTDIHGLGAYDIAAIRFGYLGYIETFDDGHPMVELFDSAQGDQEHVIRQRMFNKLQNRSFSEFDPNAIEVDDEYGFEYIIDKDGAKKFLNKHTFCSDTWADFFDLNCSRWDIGRDPIEISMLYGERLRETYDFLNYRRGNSNAPWSFNGSIINTVYQRYFWYAARAGILASYLNNIYGLNTVEWLESGSGLSIYHQLGAFTLNEVVNTLMTPNVGDYEWDETFAAPVLDRAFEGADATLENGTYVHPTWSEYGYENDEYSTVNRYGFYNNKIGAMLALLAGFNANLSQFTQGDVSQNFGSLSLANAFPGETTEVLKSLLTGEAGRYSHVPAFQQQGNFYIAGPGQTVEEVLPGDRVLLDLFHLYGTQGPTVDDTMPRVDAGLTSYEFQYGYIWASLLKSPFDRTWERWMQLRQKGDSLAGDYADPARVVEWTDSSTGITWQAYTYDSIRAINGLDVDPSVAAHFLNYITTEEARLDALILAGDEDAPFEKEFLLDTARWKLDLMYSVNEMFAY